MNIKAISILTAVLMVVAALGGAMLLDRADAATEEFTDEMGLDEVDVVKEQEATVVLLKVSEAEFLPLGYTLTWYVASAKEGSAGKYSATFDEKGKLGSRTVSADSSSNLESYSAFTSTTSTESITIDNYQFKMEEVEGNLGHYLLSISTDGADAIFALKCSITSVNGSYDEVPAVYGILKTNVVEPTTSTLDAMTVTVGVPFMKTVMVNGAAVTDGIWYAIGMPEGLSMSPSGVVSGIATGNDSDGSKINGSVKVNVYKTTGVDSDITITPYTLQITVSESTRDFSIQIAVDGTQQTGSGPYSVQQNSTVKLTVTPENVVEVAYVSMIGDDGVTYLGYGEDGGEDGVTIPTSGIGKYTIAVHAVVDGVVKTKSVTLQVISDLDVLTPSIVITGA